MMLTPVVYQLKASSFPISKGSFKRNTPISGSSSIKPKSNSFSTSRDSEWLTLEVCREFLRGTCPREELTCRYAHPPKNISCSNSRVVCCYDYIKGRCHRYQPPCKYLHPPNHLKEQLLQNGKANLIMKNMQLLVPESQKSTNVSRSPSIGSYMTSMSISPRGFSHPQAIESPIMNSLRPMSYISPLPYFFMSTSDNQNVHNLYQTNVAPKSSNLQRKSIAPFGYPIPSNQGLSENILASQVPMQPYFYSCGPGSQLFVKNWPICTYSSVPY